MPRIIDTCWAETGGSCTRSPLQVDALPTVLALQPAVGDEAASSDKGCAKALEVAGLAARADAAVALSRRVPGRGRRCRGSSEFGVKPGGLCAGDAVWDAAPGHTVPDLLRATGRVRTAAPLPFDFVKNGLVTRNDDASFFCGLSSGDEGVRRERISRRSPVWFAIDADHGAVVFLSVS